MYGKLSKNTLTANTPLVLYTAPAKCKFVKATVRVLNAGTEDTIFKMGVTDGGALTAVDYIESGAVIPANGGTLTTVNVELSPGEKIIAQCNKDGVVIRISGQEIVAVS